jgi:cytochrome P450
VAAVTELDLPQLDITDAALTGARFHAAVGALREQGWLAGTPLGAIVVLDRAAGEEVLRSKAMAFPLRPILDIFSIHEGPLHDEMVHNIITIEGADHRRLRALVNRFFTPRAADARRPALRALLDELVPPFVAAGGGDAVAALAQPYPARVIAELLGAPAADAPRLARWSAVIQRQFDAIALLQDRAAIEQAVTELHGYLAEQLAARRAAPGEDLLSHLLAVEAEGERLSAVEAVNLALNVLIGGVDTTQAQLAHGLRLFAEHPEQWDALAADPSLAPAAVEEILRVEPITPFSARMAVEDVTVRDVTFPAGTVVMVAACAANRETGGGAFDITAERSSRILTFGAGTHYCLGANLARAELEEAFAHLARRVARIELAGEPDFDTPTGIYQLRALPLSLTPRRGA